MCSVFAGRKADANIYLFEKDLEDFCKNDVSIAIGRKELDEYYELLKKEATVEFVNDIEDTPWGWRMFEVKDEDGNGLQFFAFLEGSNGPYEKGQIEK